MGLDYNIYHTKTGKLISKDRYGGMPFLWEEASPYTHTCAVKGSFDKIDQWTIDENSELWKSEMDKAHGIKKMMLYSIAQRMIF